MEPTWRGVSYSVSTQELDVFLLVMGGDLAQGIEKNVMMTTACLLGRFYITTPCK